MCKAANNRYCLDCLNVVLITIISKYCCGKLNIRQTMTKHYPKSMVMDVLMWNVAYHRLHLVYCKMDQTYRYNSHLQFNSLQLLDTHPHHHDHYHHDSHQHHHHSHQRSDYSDTQRTQATMVLESKHSTTWMQSSRINAFLASGG